MIFQGGFLGPPWGVGFGVFGTFLGDPSFVAVLSQRAGYSNRNNNNKKKNKKHGNSNTVIMIADSKNGS